MIEMRKTGMFYKNIARHFGSKTEYVQAICKGERWKGIVEDHELPIKTSRTTVTQYAAMIQMRQDGLAAADIAKQLGVTDARVFAALRRKGFGRAVTGRHKRLTAEVAAAKPCSEHSRMGR